MDVDVQLADGRWDRAEVLAEGLDPGHGWRILLRWGGGYQAWFIPDPAKIRLVSLATRIRGHELACAGPGASP